MSTTSAPSLDAIAAALAQAQAAAAQVANQAPAAPAPAANVPAVSQAPATPARLTPGKPLTMAEMMATRGQAVDLWLKVGFHGITVGKDSTLLDKITGVVDLASVKPFYGVRYGNPPVYNHSYDGVVAAKGNKAWADVMADAYRIEAGNPNFRGEYPGAEVVIVPIEDIKGKKGEVIAPAGKKLGLSTSITNFREWEEFYSLCLSKGFEGQKVIIDLTFEAQDYKGKWGKFIFGEPKLAQ